MATRKPPDKALLILYCAYAQKNGYPLGQALSLYRHHGGAVGSDYFRDAWRVAASIPNAFGLGGVATAARITAEGER